MSPTVITARPPDTRADRPGDAGDRTDPSLRRLAVSARSGLGTVSGLVLGAPLFVLCVGAPWVLQRLLRFDPLRSATGPEGTVRLLPVDERPRRLWAEDATRDRLPAGHRFRRRLQVPLAVLVLVVGTVVVVVPDPDSSGVPAALASSPWWPQYRELLVYQQSQGWDLEGAFPPRMLDFASPLLNVRDGHRVSWTAPPCDCRRVRLWMYGGSTTFGMGQRDEHTVASELARLAWEDGIALDVDNRGVPGDTHWSEALRFAWDLSVEDPPDEVVFYDGHNDLGASYLLNRQQPGDADVPADLMYLKNSELIVPMIGLMGFMSDPFRSMPDGAVLGERDPTTPLGPTELGRAAGLRFNRAKRISEGLGERSGVSASWFWQPVVDSRPRIAGEPASPAGVAENYRLTEDAVMAVIDADVVDLRRVLDRPSGPVFYDPVHVNEDGARLVARAIYSSLRDRLLERSEAG